MPTIAELLGSSEPADRLFPGYAFWFQGNPPFESATEHCFFVLAVASNGNLLMVNATSKVEKTQSIISTLYRDFVEDPSLTLVLIEPGESSLLRIRSIVNCNEVHSVRPEDINRGDSRFVAHESDNDLFRRFAIAVKASPNVSPDDCEVICRQRNV